MTPWALLIAAMAGAIVGDPEFRYADVLRDHSIVSVLTFFILSQSGA